MINLSNTTPAAPTGGANVSWQEDSSGNVSAYASIIPGGAKQTVAPVSNVLTIDASLGASVLINVNAEITSMSIINPTDGQELLLLWAQDATGHSITIASNIQNAPTIGTAANDYTYFSLVYNAADTTWYAPASGGSGTVTSVAMTVPARQSVSGSPITTSGTLAVTDNNQDANLVFAGPASGSAAAPTFRAIEPADLPVATDSALGVVKPDGSTITISGGVISSSGGGFSNPMTTEGDIIVGGSSGTPERLGAGTSGYVLTSNGSGSLPSWQASGGSNAVDILSPDRATGTVAYQKNEYTTVTNSSTLNLLNYSGSDGYVDSIMLAYQGEGDPSSSLINIYYDGEGTPTISAELQHMFMGVYMWPSNDGPSFFGNAAVQFNSVSGSPGGGCYVLKLPIPFTNQIKIDFVNNSGGSATVWSVVEYQTGVPNTWPNTRKLRLSTYYGSAVAPNTIVPFADYAGSAGRFVGLYFLDDGYPGSVSYDGAPLEGNVRLYLDAATKQWLASTSYSLGDTIIDTNGNLQTVTTAGTSGSSEPSWGNLTGNTTTDNTVTWTCTVGDPPNVWLASKSYVLGMSILDSNGNVQTVTTAGTSGSSAPTWNTSGTTTDNTVTWTASSGSSMVRASIQSSGTEDWFGMGFYFGAHNASQYAGSGGGNSNQISGGWSSGTGDRGVTFIGSPAGLTQGAYRLHLSDKKLFTNSIAIRWNCGDTTEEAWTGNDRVWATAYYYTED